MFAEHYCVLELCVHLTSDVHVAHTAEGDEKGTFNVVTDVQGEGGVPEQPVHEEGAVQLVAMETAQNHGCSALIHSWSDTGKKDEHCILLKLTK